MEKRTIIILSLLSAFISLIYILLNYFGFLRYISLFIYPIEKYSKNYSKLYKLNKDKKIIISLATDKKEMKKLSPVIKSLLDQTVRADLISVVIPYGKEYTLPIHLKNCVSIYRTKKNYGDLNAIIPTALREGDSRTKIICLGADKIYGKDFIESLLEKSNEDPTKIVYCNDFDIMDIRKGILFPIDVFSEDFFNPPKNIESNKWVNYFFNNKKKNRIEYKENYKR